MVNVEASTLDPSVGEVIVGARGGTVSTEKVRAGDDGPTFSDWSVATAVTVYVPSANVVVIDHEPSVPIRELPTRVVPRQTRTVPSTSAAGIVPRMVTAWVVTYELFVGATMTGAGGGVNSFMKFSTDHPVIKLCHATCHHQLPSAKTGPPTIFPFVVLGGISPTNVPESDGVVRTLRLEVAPTNSPDLNFVDLPLAGGAGGGSGGAVARTRVGSTVQPVKFESNAICHHQFPSTKTGPPMTAPWLPLKSEPKNCAALPATPRTMMSAVACTLLPTENFVDGPVGSDAVLTGTRTGGV